MDSNNSVSSALEMLREQLAEAQARAIRSERFFAQAQSQLDKLTNLIGTNDPDLIAKEINENRMAKKIKSNFWDMISHELRTPMSGILGMADLLNGTKLTDEQQDYLAGIRNSGKRITELLNMILDFSMLESNSLRIYPMPFELPEMVEEVLDVHAGQAYVNKIDLILDYSPLAPEMAIGDPGRIRQILTTLVDNAIKTTEQGFVALTVRIVPLADGSARLRISVRDTAKPIPQEKLPYLFSNYDPNDSVGLSKKDFGLDLLICDKLVHMMGGEMEAKSNPDAKVGEFVNEIAFFLPLALLYDPSYQPPKHPVLNGKHILFVGLTEPRLNVLSVSCSAIGMTTFAVKNTEEAKLLAAGKAALGNPFYAVLIDRAVVDDHFATDMLSITECAPSKLILMMNPIEAHDQSLTLSDQDKYTAICTKPVHIKRLTAVLVEDKSTLKQQDLSTPDATEHFSPSRLESVNAITANGRILIIHNTKVSRQRLKQMCERFGFAAHTVGSVEEAEHMLDTVRYHLLIISCHLVEMDQGFEFARKIRLDEHFENMKILGISAFAGDGDAIRAKQYGMIGCLQEPVKAAELSKFLTNINK